MRFPIPLSKGSREPSVRPSFQRPLSLDPTRQCPLAASVTGGSELPIVHASSCPRSSCGRPLPCRCSSLSSNHSAGSSATTRRPPPRSLSLGLECVSATEHVSDRRVWAVAGAARALCLLPTGYNVTAPRSGAFPVFDDQSGAGSPVLYL